MAASKATRQRIVDETFAVGQSEVISSQAKELATDGLVSIHPLDSNVSNPTQKVRVRATQKLADEYPSNVAGNDVSSVAYPVEQTGTETGDSQTNMADEQTIAEVAPNAYPVSDAVAFTGTIRNAPERTSKYPFASLAAPADAGDGKMKYSSFHIAATPEFPLPHKKYAGVVSTATMSAKKKSIDPNTKKVVGTPAKFVIREAQDGDPNGKGARVFRVQ